MGKIKLIENESEYNLSFDSPQSNNKRFSDENSQRSDCTKITFNPETKSRGCHCYKTTFQPCACFKGTLYVPDLKD
ncbi:MAG: hypothetical protein A2X08_10460 [Bacteroidetes bacterium GWA2_32_17]|nr:MAG: hypothetical protein A2X08_10460 [Bacteroidetes bacterium GWA2_32_17]